MLKNISYLKRLSLISIFIATTSFASTVWTPEAGQEVVQIPSGYQDLLLQVTNDNPIKYIYLPDNAQNGDKITIEYAATQGQSSKVFTENSDFPGELSPPAMQLAKNIDLRFSSPKTHVFIYNTTLKLWEYQPTKLFVPSSDITTYSVPLRSENIFGVSLDSTSQVQNIVLPTAIKNGQLLKIVSNADHNISIDSSNILFSSTLQLEPNQYYWFEYNTTLGQWSLLANGSKPEFNLVRDPLYPDNIYVPVKLPTPTTAVTEWQFDNASPKNIILPSAANDRDRIIVTSNYTLTGTAPSIKNNYLSNKAAAMISTGQRYEFIYIADKKYWVAVVQPQHTHGLKSTYFNYYPTPVSRLNITDDFYRPNITLAKGTATLGNQFIVNNSSSKSMYIKIAETGAIREILPNETVRFNCNGKNWEVASQTIDLLLVNSPQVNKTLGESAAKIRILEAMNIANIAAESSNANVYFRAAGFFTYSSGASSIAATLSRLENTTSTSTNAVQTERDLVGADGILYQGAETKDACGIGTVSASNANDLIAVQQYTCSLNVTGHELGHNLGLSHEDEVIDSSSTLRRPYARGFTHPLANTIMYSSDNINNLAYYSSPLIYEARYGLRLGDADTADNTRRINEMSATLASFR